MILKEKEQDWVERILKQDSKAEDELIRFVRPTVFLNIVKRLGSRHNEVQPLVNEILMSVIESIRTGSFNPEQGALQNYVGGVVNFRMSKFFRDTGRAARETVDADEIATEPDQLTSLENSERKEQLRQAMRTLKNKYQDILALRYFDELSIDELSERLGLEKRRVSERINYALKLLKKELQADKKFSIFSILWVICT